MSSESAIGHRERLRERFVKSGFRGFHDYEVLELLLSFIFRRGDVKPLAKELIKRFGSFSQVLDAPIEELKTIKGMGKASAVGLCAFRHAMAFYYNDKAIVDPIQLTKMSSLVEMLHANIGFEQNEVLYAVFLNARNDVLASKALGEGTVTQAAAFPRRILEEALRLKATSIILAHNHPGGVAEPSEQDITITTEIQKVLGIMGISLQDHIILAGKDYYSFNRNHLI